MFEENNENHSFRSFEKSPIYKKAILIWDLAHHIAELAAKSEVTTDIDLERNVLKDYAGYIMEDASKIAPKIAGASGDQIYDLKMENAAIIRKAARELSVHMTALEMYGFKETDYCDLLRAEIEEFRILFAEWVKTFDPWNYIIDRWGLFNPPGVSYDDHDPDDDIPFDSSEFFDDFFDDFEDCDNDEEDDSP